MLNGSEHFKRSARTGQTTVDFDENVIIFVEELVENADQYYYYYY